jgi:hypothetical protein
VELCCYVCVRCGLKFKDDSRCYRCGVWTMETEKPELYDDLVYVVFRTFGKSATPLE